MIAIGVICLRISDTSRFVGRLPVDNETAAGVSGGGGRGRPVPMDTSHMDDAYGGWIGSRAVTRIALERNLAACTVIMSLWQTAPTTYRQTFRY